MRRKSRKQKREEFKRRYDSIEDLVSTFAMPTVAVFAVATVIHDSPKVEIIKTVVLNGKIVY